jgi:hypothetical protein
MRNAYAGLQQFEPGPADLIGIGVRYYYHAGFFVGFAYELVLSTLAVGVATGGVVAVLRLGLTALKAVTWVATLTAKAAAVLRVSGYALQWLARTSGARALARTTLTFLLESGELVGRFVGKYDKVRRVAEALTEALVGSRQVAERALYWLTILDTMSEEAGARFVFFVRNKTAEVADQWLARWTALTNGKRAVKDAFEAYDRLQDAGEGTAHALTLMADLDHPVAGENFAREYVQKYGDQVEATLSRLRTDLGDARYSDEVIARTGRVHATSAPAGGFSPDAVEGSARFLRDAGAPLDDVERATEALFQLDRTKMDDNFRLLREADTTPDDVQGFYALAEDGLSCRLTSGRP